MKTYTFKIKEVNRDGYIAWDAIEVETDNNFPVNQDGYLEAGRFPEITDYLKRDKNIDFDVSYNEKHQDSLKDLVWTFKRGDYCVIVQDIPRTIIRFSGFQ